MADCVYGGSIAAADNTGCERTTAWNVNASFEHYWTPQWHQSLAGAYINVKYDSLANAMLCAGASGGNGTGIGSAAVAAAGCDNNWSMWGLGSRLQWDVTKSFYLGVEVLYTHLNSANTFNGVISGTGFNINTTNAPVFQTGHLDNWSGTVRMHKDFLP